MRILYLCADHGIPVYGRRGCSTHVRETCRGLVRAGHEVTLLTSLKGEAPDGADADVEFDIIEIPPARSRKLGYDLRNFLHNRKIRAAARKIVEERRVEVLYERLSLYSLAGAWTAERYNLPRIVEINAFLSVEHRKKLHFPRMARWAERRATRSASRLIVVSPPLRDTLVEMGVEPERIVIMPIAVDTDRFRPDPEARRQIREKFKFDADRLVVGYIGGLAEWHGISMLYDLARRLENDRRRVTILVVGGKDQEVAAHRARVAEEGLEGRLLFAGGVDYEEAPAHINAMDVALVPDTLRWTCPTKMFEYQACGVPTVAPKYPAIVLSIDHGENGMLFEPYDMAGAARHILDLAENPEKRREIGEKSRKRVDAEHSWKRNVEGVTKMFDAALG